jgi:hypothetical protein
MKIVTHATGWTRFGAPGEAAPLSLWEGAVLRGEGAR